MSDAKEGTPKLTQTELEEIELRIVAALNKLYDESPYYYHFLKNLPKRFNEKVPAWAAVSMDKKTKKLQMYVNPNLTKDLSVSTFVNILQHESLHICFNHLFDDKFKKKSTALNFNKACDYIINDHIPGITSRYASIKDNLAKARKEISDVFNGEFNSKLNGHPDEIYKFMDKLSAEQYKTVQPKIQEIHDKYTKVEPHTFLCTKPAVEHIPGVAGLDFKEVTSEELYNILFKNKGDQGQDGENGEKNKMKVRITMGEPGDDHTDMEGGEGDQIPIDEITNEEIRNAIKEAVQDALDSSKSLGNMPANLSKTLFEMVKSKTNYIQIINSFATSIRDVEAIRTWSRRNRRYPSQTPGRKRDDKPSIAIVLDTSGSMWDDKIQQLMIGEIKALKDVCDSVYLIMGDTRETARIDLTEKEFDVKNFQLVGGGGTDLNFGFEAAKELKVDGVIFHTDGYISPIKDDYKIPTLWFIYPNGTEVEPQKYRNFKIENCL